MVRFPENESDSESERAETASCARTLQRMVGARHRVGVRKSGKFKKITQ